MGRVLSVWGIPSCLAGDQGLSAGDRHCSDGHGSAQSNLDRMKALLALEELPALTLLASYRWAPQVV